jgi:ephrin-B
MAIFMAAYSDLELLRSSVVIESEIGAGEFGSVCSGYYRRPDGSKRTIAIKTLKDSSKEENKVKFLQEASIMLQFKHPKIVALVGVVTKADPVLICLEFMELGSLRSYLRSELVIDQLTDADFLRMACDVCSAMHYLGESGFVHRDLAARNVLINKDFVCKVCDFGLSQETKEVHTAGNDKIPIRWTAPEAIQHSKFSTSSDVWSYGILLWEMWSYGALPYKGMPNDVVVTQVSQGYRMPNPKGCPSFVHSLMLSCWNDDLRERPTFFDVFERLLAFWVICKPATSENKLYSYDANGKQVANKRARSLYAAPKDGVSDLGSEDSALPNAKNMRQATDDDDEDDAYDLGLYLYAILFTHIFSLQISCLCS